MAKAASPDDAILGGLRKAMEALPDPLKLTGPGGVFPGGAKGQELADAAIVQGLLTKETRRGSGRSARAVEYALLTEQGIRRVIEATSPKAALESLLPAVQALGKESQSTSPNVDAFRDGLAKAAATCVNAVQDAFAKLQEQMAKALAQSMAKLEEQVKKTLPQPFAKLESEVLKALPPPPAPAADPRPVLSAIQHALEKLQAQAIPTVRPPVEPKPAPPVVAKPDLDGEIVAFVTAWAKEKTVGCQFDVLWDHLKQRHPELTPGTFQDALRKLHDAGRIRLSGWPRMLDDIPKTQLALFISSKVMYYANPAHPNG